MIEEWKSIIGYEDIYIISNTGKVKNINTNKILKGHVNNDGYTVITLTKNKQREFKYLHRLVAIHFIPNPYNKPEVDHIIPISDGGTNDINNLRWATSKENTNNPISKRKSDLSKIGRKPSDKCVNECKKVLIIDKVVGINKKNNNILIFESAEQGKRSGFRHILECCRGIRKQDKGYKWYFYSDAIRLNLIDKREEDAL